MRDRLTAEIKFQFRAPAPGSDRGLSKRPEESRLVVVSREPCMVVDVTHPCNTFVSSQHLG